MKTFYFSVLLIFSFLVPDFVLCQPENISKIYPSADEVLITSTDIFVYSNNRNKLIKAEKVECEEGKICATVSDFNNSHIMRGPCNLHALYHKACGGCGVIYCPMNCTCFD